MSIAKRLIVASLVPLLAILLGGTALAAGPEDLCGEMKKELDRNLEGLKLPDYPGPYFMSYLLRDLQIAGVTARYGAPVMRKKDRQLLIDSDVRVGSFELDNSMDRYAGFDMPFRFQPFKNRAPLNAQGLSLRKTLWKLTDEDYKGAVASYLKVKAQRIYKADDPDFVGCFSKSPAVRHLDKPADFVDDLEPYEKVAVAISQRLSNEGFIQDSWVSFDASKADRYFVNSEGSLFYTSATYFSYSVQAFARAEDGTVIPHSIVLYSRKLKELPGKKELMRRVDEMVEELKALSKAEVMQPYSGPTLLEGDTAGVFLHEALGHRLEGHRQGGREEGGTFSGKVGDQILPEDISIFDDPTLAEVDGNSINGYYLLDDEGVKAQRVVLVDKGKLSGFLLTRKPIQGFKESNGHARASITAAPVARMGTLIMESRNTVPREQLKAHLIKQAKEEGKPFAIILRRAQGGATNTSSYGFQAFKGVARLVYKVDLETGEETLVRGVDLVGTPLASLMKISAVGDDRALFNGYCGAESGFVPVSTLTPSLVLSELEFQKAPPMREQKEILPPPE
jgi:TldD protein